MNVFGKWGIVGLLVVLLGAGLALGMGSRSGTPGPAGALDVNSVASDPSAYKGSIQVRGAVANVYPADSVFLLIDIREYKACGVVTCASKSVPVHYAGTPPKVEEELLVTGEMVSSPKGYVLAGKELQRLGQ
jgi:hypothetical protein